MKKLLSLAIIGISLICKAQTNTDIPSWYGELWDTLGHTNLMVAPYGIWWHGDKIDKFGGGIGLLYKLSDYTAAGMRLDYIDKQVFMPSGQFQLQVPVSISANVKAIPFAFTGVAVPLQYQNAGNAIGIFGIGAAIQVSSHVDIVFDYEKWSNFNGNQLRFGFLYKF